jgi:hypothetical protein
MKWKKWLENWGMTKLKVKTSFLEMEWQPQNADKSAAWELYIELLTRVATQYLLPEQGDEQAALDSIYELFDLTRGVIKNYGRDCMEFTKLAILVLNQVIRPFTAKWHRLGLAGAFDDEEKCRQFRAELQELQVELRRYAQMLADMADVEDLTRMEDV